MAKRGVSASFKLEGMDDLKAAFKRMGAATSRERLGRAAIKALEPMEAAAKRNAPVKTGELRGSIGSQVWKLTADGVDAEVYAAAKHAHLVEFGHGGAKPAAAKPFIRNAFDSTKGEVERSAGQELGRIIEDAAVR